MVKNLTVLCWVARLGTHLTTHINTNAVMDFHCGVVQAVFGHHEALVLFLLLLPACCGILEMSLLFINQVVPLNKYFLYADYTWGCDYVLWGLDQLDQFSDFNILRCSGNHEEMLSVASCCSGVCPSGKKQLAVGIQRKCLVKGAS